MYQVAWKGEEMIHEIGGALMAFIVGGLIGSMFLVAGMFVMDKIEEWRRG